MLDEGSAAREPWTSWTGVMDGGPVLRSGESSARVDQKVPCFLQPGRGRGWDGIEGLDLLVIDWER